MWKILYKNILALYRYSDFPVAIFYFAYSTEEINKNT